MLQLTKRYAYLVIISLFIFSCDQSELNEMDGTPIEASANVTGGQINVNVDASGNKASFFGAGHYFWSGHLMNGITNKSNAHKWIWDDLNVNMTRVVFRATAEVTNDNSNPDNMNYNNFDFSNGNIQNQIKGVKEAKSRNSNIKVWAVVLSPPAFLKTNNSNLGGGTLKYIDQDTEFKEFGEFILAHLRYHKEQGVEIDYLSIMNEPDIDLDHEDASFSPDWAWWVYRRTVPYLEANVGQYGISMPVIAGAETLNIGNADTYISKVKHAYPNAGLFSTHQYGGNTAANWQNAASEAGTKPLIMSEYKVAHLISDPNEMTEGLRMGQRMVDAFRNGASGYLYFSWAGPQDNFQGLLHTPWGQNAVRRKNYFFFKQFTDGVLNRNIVPSSTSGVSKFSSGNVVAFTSGRTAYIHVMNWSGDWQSQVRVDIGKTIKNVEIWRTKSNENVKSIWTASNVNLNYYNVSFAPKSMTTIKFTW